MAKKNILTKGKKAKAEQLALNHQMEDAEVLYVSVCKTDPLDVEAWVKLSVVQCRLAKYAQAEASVRRALRLAPKLEFAQQALTTILQYQGKADEASNLLQTTLSERPNSSESLVNLAKLREKQGRVEEAFKLYHQALDLQPETAYVIAKRGELLEREGRVTEAQTVIAQGLNLEPGHPDLNLMAARLDRRAGRNAQAVMRLEAMLPYPMPPETAAEIHFLLGQLHDLLGNTGKVLPYLIEGRRRVTTAIDPAGRDRARFLARIVTIRSWLNDRLVAAPALPVVPAETPIFLIGFLRSGTTLLEQILDSHPGLQALNEKPMGEVMEQAFLTMTGGGTDALANLSMDQITRLRQVYWEEAARHCERQADTLLVDKQPFNMIRAPLLWRVFPQARFILTIRHPCDVTLGCLMQNFGYHNVMSAFASLERIAELYAEVMKAWQACTERLPLNWQRIRYEDLVTSFEPEARALLKFLDLDWSDRVLGHTEHAQQRGIINTPSYHQVTQPIYQHAKYRWKRYEKEFEPVLQVLQPFIEQYGYAS